MAIEQELLDAIQQQTNILKGMAGSRSSSTSTSTGQGINFDEVEKASSNLAKSLYGKSKSVSSSLINFGDNIKDAGSAVAWFTGLLGLGGLGGLIINSMEQYKDFIKVGQTFSGHLMEMGRTAALTHQSLEEMYKGFRAGGQAAATLGVELFSQLSSAVRDNIRQFGSFGLSISEVNEFMGDQLETLRLTGLLESIDRRRLARDFSELQIQTTGLSAITGKARDDILKQTMAFQKQNIAFRGYMATLPSDIRESVHKSAQHAINIFSSLPDEISELLSSGLSEGLALGSVYMSESFKDISMLAPEVTASLEEVRRIASRGGDTTEATYEMFSKIKNLSPKLVEAYNIQAAAGNESANQLVKLYTSVQNINIEESKAAALRAARFGASEQFYLNFGQNMSVIFGEMKLLFFNAFKPALEAIVGPGGKGGILSEFADVIRDLSGSDGPLFSFGKMLGDAIRGWRETWPEREVLKENIKAFISSVVDSTTMFLKWSGVMTEAGNLDFPGLLKNVKSVIAAVMDGFVGFLSFIDSIPGVDIGSENRHAISMSAANMSGKYNTNELRVMDKAGSVLSKFDELTGGIFEGYNFEDQAIVAKQIESMVTDFLKDSEIDSVERKALLEVMDQGTVVNKQVLTELQKQTNMQGASLDTMDEALKEQKVQSRTAKNGMLSGGI